MKKIIFLFLLIPSFVFANPPSNNDTVDSSESKIELVATYEEDPETGDLVLKDLKLQDKL